jgi:oligoendopeptidase F
MVERYEALDERLGRAYSYASSSSPRTATTPRSAASSSPCRSGSTTSRPAPVRHAGAEQLDDAHLAERVAASARLARFRPWLDQVRSYRPHQLSDEVERTLHEKRLTGRSAWNRLFDETSAALRFPTRGRSSRTPRSST